MIFQLTYRSEAFPWITIEDIHDILAVSRTFNSSQDITGCLIYTSKFFVQLLEGDKTLVEKLYTGIEKDKRHFDVNLITTKAVQERSFSKWAMAYLNPKGEISHNLGDEVRQQLEVLASGSADLDFDLDKFWINVHDLLEESGHYQN